MRSCERARVSDENVEAEGKLRATMRKDLISIKKPTQSVPPESRQRTQLCQPNLALDGSMLSCNSMGKLRRSNMLVHKSVYADSASVGLCAKGKHIFFVRHSR